MAAILKLLHEKWYPPAEPSSSFAHKTVLLTGGTAGLGLEAAVKYLSLGASTLIIGARNPAKAQAAKATIEARSCRPGAVQMWPLDMNSFASVQAFAERASRELDRLDVALLNAGLFMREYRLSEDGWEETLQVNALSTVLLGLLLLPKLRASGTVTEPAHLAITSSSLHKKATRAMVDVEGGLLQHLNAPDGFSRDRQYCTSKLLVEYAVQTMGALVLEQSGGAKVLVNSLSPGLCASELARGFDAWYQVLLKKIGYMLVARTAEQGARSLVSGTAQGLEGQGKSWRNDEWEESTPLRLDKVIRETAWTEMVGALEGNVPQVKEIAKL
ncbi:hypothetical protein MMC26_002904 [Xylographa opegraphella]|nr:hypothetical protein [Xylographa opegraphella]